MNSTEDSGPMVSLKKSFSSNSQLQFSKLITVCTYDADNSEPFCDQLKFQNFIRHEDSPVIAMYCIADRRDEVVDLIIKYFPLTREKYRITVQCAVVTGSEEGIEVEVNEDSGFKELREANEEAYGTILKRSWESMNEQERKGYKKITPGTLQDSEKQIEVENDDLSKYEPQNIDDRAPNSFCMCIFYPTKIDITIYPQPQVIADARHPQFESLMKAPKKARRYLHVYNYETDAWETSELNP